MNRFTRSIAMASARHPWRTIAAWVVVLGAVFALAGSGGGAFIDAFSAKGSQSERAMQLLEDKFPEATQAQALVVFAVDDGQTLQSQRQGGGAGPAPRAGARPAGGAAAPPPARPAPRHRQNREAARPPPPPPPPPREGG